VIAKVFCLALATALVVGCTHARPESSEPPARVMIKFADASHPPPDAFQVRMSDGSAIILRHERAMSGEAHLYNARMTDGQLEAIVDNLNQRSDIEYAEVDRKVGF
jgi:hypothetical protein